MSRCTFRLPILELTVLNPVSHYRARTRSDCLDTTHFARFSVLIKQRYRAICELLRKEMSEYAQKKGSALHDVQRADGEVHASRIRAAILPEWHCLERTKDYFVRGGVRLLLQ